MKIKVFLILSLVLFFGLVPKTCVLGNSTRKLSAHSNLVNHSHSPVMEVWLSLEQVDREYQVLRSKFGAKNALKMMDERVMCVVSHLKSMDQVGLLAVVSANAFHSSDRLTDSSWNDLGHLVYIVCLDKLSRDHTPKAKGALRRVSEALRGELFDTHIADMWIQSAMKQNGEQIESDRAAWYIEQSRIQKYVGLNVKDLQMLKEQEKNDVSSRVKIPENIAPGFD